MNNKISIDGTPRVPGNSSVCMQRLMLFRRLRVKPCRMATIRGGFVSRLGLLNRARASSLSVPRHVREFRSSTPRRDTWDPWNRMKAAHRTEGAHFPEILEHWNRDRFYKLGGGLAVASAAALYGFGPLSIKTWALVGATAMYWRVGLKDLSQTEHTLRRNFPFLAHMRYLLESIRPEIRQYFIESDLSGRPFDRLSRNVVYQRAKGMADNLAFGTRRDVYEPGYMYVAHSLYPVATEEVESRVRIGGPDCAQPYSASLLNVSAMSYGSLSSAAVTALNRAAAFGGFYHNTGEGGVSPYHLQGGDVCWNIGTGYFSCRTLDGRFCPDAFQKLALLEAIKMIEIKLSQGAKPSHGGILPADKLTAEIAEIRGVPMGKDVNSPPQHSAFGDPVGMMQFVKQLRELSGGKPVGIKLCVGRINELAAIVHAMVSTGITPDFITVDGGEGGTGAAPYEFSNAVGAPLQEGLHAVNTLLRGADLRDRVTVICSGKVTTGFSIVQNLAMGADLCNAARAMMFALGCIQALKCHSNKCPTGVATQDKHLMAGLDVPDKATRVAQYQKATVHAAQEIMGAMGVSAPSLVEPRQLLCRGEDGSVQTFEARFPQIPTGALVRGDELPENLASYTQWWEAGRITLDKMVQGTYGRPPTSVRKSANPAAANQ